MISIHHNTKDPYIIYGITHFIQRYGLVNKKGSKINLIHGDLKDMDGFKIQIVENEIQNGISGYLKTENEEETSMTLRDTHKHENGEVFSEQKIPLFEKPIKLNEKGKTLVTFVDEENEYSCVALKDNTIIMGFDIFNEVGHILAGYLEHFWKTGENKHKQLARIPVVDYYEKILFDCLLLASKKSNAPLKYKPFWPNGKKFAVCLTHDVDKVKKTFQYVTHTIRHLEKGEISLAFIKMLPLIRRENPYWNFDRIMEIEKELGVKSTFFFLNEEKKVKLFSPREWKLYWGRYNIKNAKIVEIIKKLDAGGWEIGIHGSYNSYKDIKKLEEEKKTLEGILGKNIHGISQHYCNLDIPETWEYHEKLGLAYDSTMGFVTDVGFKWGTCYPFHPFNPAKGKTLSVWELPIIIMDNAYAYKNWDDMVNIIDIVEKHNGLLLLRWHQSIFDEREFPGRSSMYEKIIGICKEKDAWITNAYNIAKWLTQREKQTLYSY